MSARREVCRACAHWAPFPASDWMNSEHSPLGECRVFSPEVRWYVDAAEEPGIKTRWPKTRADHWCGWWFPARPDDE